MTAFFQMGGYAFFVWPAMGLTVAVMGGLLVATLRQLRARQHRLAELGASGAQRSRRARPAAASAPDHGSAGVQEARP